MRRPYFVKSACYMLFIFVASTALTLAIKYGLRASGDKYNTDTIDCNELAEVYSAEAIKD